MSIPLQEHKSHKKIVIQVLHLAILNIPHLQSITYIRNFSLPHNSYWITLTATNSQSFIVTFKPLVKWLFFVRPFIPGKITSTTVTSNKVELMTGIISMQYNSAKQENICRTKIISSFSIIFPIKLFKLVPWQATAISL